MREVLLVHRLPHAVEREGLMREEVHGRVDVIGLLGLRIDGELNRNPYHGVVVEGMLLGMKALQAGNGLVELTLEGVLPILHRCRGQRAQRVIARHLRAPQAAIFCRGSQPAAHRRKQEQLLVCHHRKEHANLQRVADFRPMAHTILGTQTLGPSAFGLLLASTAHAHPHRSSAPLAEDLVKFSVDIGKTPHRTYLNKGTAGKVHVKGPLRCPAHHGLRSQLREPPLLAQLALQLL
mmetsp:Transcript_125326/g.304318  ORF Transcript_125326/g.304318 Transcript_125326/m.304318 type:complete len:236 (-) Transcript_125326:1428-2135(-)